MKSSIKIFAHRSYVLVFSAVLFAAYSGCTDSHSSIVRSNPQKVKNLTPSILPAMADAQTILSRPQVPILCYHQIREWRPTDSKRAKDYIVPPSNFHEQMKWLADHGYHTILPDQLYNYLVYGEELPAKPIMISFDDSRLEQFTLARDEMSRYGFKGVFFIMTVSLGRPGYMSRQEVKELADEGNVIGSHTWNHSNVKHYSGEDWRTQVDKPSQELEKITGQPIKYFAYPFGLWNRQAIEELKRRGFKAAFQLSEKRDEDYPQFCIRRVIVPGEWSTSTLERWMKNSF